MAVRWLIAILTLPGTVAVVVPSLVLLATRGAQVLDDAAPLSSLPFWLAALIFAFGFSLGAWTMILFWRIGIGTPAPWDPPTRLVVRGPYCHVRNPMITSVLAILLGEACLFQSLPLAAWFAVFFIGNAIYFPTFEEPGLAKRFGDDYEMYSRNVGRWIPRLTPWTLPNETDSPDA